MDYKSAGVDVEAGEELVDWLKSSESSRTDSRVVSGIGGFAAVFRASFPNLRKPCLVSSTDGVGTKLLWGIESGRYQGLGQDVVAMCVNDLVCVGADPLFFLDYFACGKLDQKQAQEFLKGVRAACDESNCTLLGGETAEMPGMYSSGHFDCAGFSVGVVDEDEMWGAHRVVPGDQLVGIKSSGFHSNGYSLLRKLFADDWKTKQEELLAPTRLYVRLTQSLRQQGVKIHAAAHITGGGIQNLPRVLPSKTMAHVHRWQVPDLVLEAKERARLSWPQLLDTFNCGVGMIFVLPEQEADKILKAYPEDALRIGEVREGLSEEPSVELEGWT
jgi:phosphoribosylformylglycinamidine cyclo-ligase